MPTSHHMIQPLVAKFVIFITGSSHSRFPFQVDTGINGIERHCKTLWQEGMQLGQPAVLEATNSALKQKFFQMSGSYLFSK